MYSIRWLVLAASLAALSCDSTDRDFSSGAGGGGGSGGGDGGGGGSSECPATHVCVPQVPEGWTGPVTHVLGAAIPECPAEYPVLETDSNATFVVPMPVCQCECGAPSVTCSTVRHVGYGGTCPLDPQGENTLVNGQCVTTDTSRGFRQPPPQASCGMPTMVEDIQPASFADQARICGGGAIEGQCSGTGLCAPKPAGDFKNVCVYRSGEEACPAGYPTQTVLYNGFSDNRACLPCLCEPNGAQCTGAITVFQTSNCTGANIQEVVKDTTTVENPLCVPFNWVSVKYESTTVNAGTCELVGGGLEGDAVPTDPMTVCCTP
ncbi:MAG: hypothetical protein HUU21_13085 [Polyangiaceae bacterium]|nr:hypothetical protein [Polyangiaceae bacterium]